jgi:hypothetical protein
MISNRLSDTRIEVLRGSVMVECDELLKDNAVSLVFQGDTIQLQKHGLYRLDAGSAQFQVYQGEAVVDSASGQTKLKGGKQATLAAQVAAQHFDENRAKDDFYQWSSQRSSNLAYATVTTSQSVLNNGTAWHTGGWMWSSLLDEWTYLPGAGLLYSPFGWGFWSPLYMGYYYTPVYPVVGGGTSVNRGFGSGTGVTRGPGATPGNPRPGRPVPGFAVANSAQESGSRYGGVAAVSRPAGFAGGGYRGGFAGGGFSGGGFSPASSGAGSSAPTSGGGNAGGGFHGGGGFSGGGHSAGGGSHR